jgi:hypothetical protein
MYSLGSIFSGLGPTVRLYAGQFSVKTKLVVSLGLVD